MQQLNSGYRGDTSETLGSIMQGQYAPLAMLNQFTNALTQTGLNNASATQRAAMQIDAQRELEKNRLRASQSQFDKTYSLQEITEGAKAKYYEAGANKDALAGKKAGAGARGKIMSRMADLQMLLSNIPKGDPKRAIIEAQLKTLNTAMSLGDDEVVGFAGASGQMSDRPDLAAVLLQALGGGKPATPATPVVPYDPLTDLADAFPTEDNYQDLVGEREAAWSDPEVNGEPAPAATKPAPTPGRHSKAPANATAPAEAGADKKPSGRHRAAAS